MYYKRWSVFILILSHTVLKQIVLKNSVVTRSARAVFEKAGTHGLVLNGRAFQKKPWPTVGLFIINLISEFIRFLSFLPLPELKYSRIPSSIDIYKIGFQTYLDHFYRCLPYMMIFGLNSFKPIWTFWSILSGINVKNVI